MSSESLIDLIDRARRLADAQHPILARAGRYIDLIRQELRGSASDTTAAVTERARRRLAEETVGDGPTPDRS